MVLNSGNWEVVCVRERRTQTLYVSDVFEPSTCKDPSYGKLHVGIGVAAIQDAMDRAKQLSNDDEDPADGSDESMATDDRDEAGSRGGRGGNRGGRGGNDRGVRRGNGRGGQGDSRRGKGRDQTKSGNRNEGGSGTQRAHKLHNAREIASQEVWPSLPLRLQHIS
jgi:hypothetical protein